MGNDYDDIDNAARELIERYGTKAACIAYQHAEIAEERQRDMPSAEIWRDIADAIKRCSMKL